MPTLALNVEMHGKQVAIIGGGAVALRKLRTLRAAGAVVRVTAPDVCPEIADLNGSDGITVTVGEYRAADADHAFLVIAATDNPLVNARVCADARARGILVAVADSPEAGDCTFPALLRRGDLEIAVSTGGRCPTFAADVRDGIAGHVGDEYGVILDLLAAEREKLLTNGSSSTYNGRVLRSLARRLLAEVTERKESPP
jgi:precorrin-2 dehydrogenase/sirohydrochlorin ferrochelatase